MTLPAVPNPSTPTTLRRGDDGWPVFALQRGLDTIAADVVADGDFGPQTERAVRDLQSSVNLAVDGIAGPRTQRALVAVFDERTHDAFPDLPAGLMRGLAEAESGNLLGAVNWSVSGGVDCGVVQRRVFGPPYGLDALRDAYAPLRAMRRAADEYVQRVATYRFQPYAVRVGREWAKRCAALAHNWPWAAGEYARSGRLPDGSKRATWAPVGSRFPDGTPVVTWDDWARFYALGGPHGEGRVTRYVGAW